MEHEASQKHGMETHLIGSSCKNLLWLELIMGGPQVSATIDKVEAFLKSEFMSLTKLKKKAVKVNMSLVEITICNSIGRDCILRLTCFFLCMKHIVMKS